MANNSNIFMVTTDEENVAVFTNGIVTMGVLEKHLLQENFEFTDIFPVKKEDLQYYLYEPLNLKENQELNLMNIHSGNPTVYKS